FVFHAEDGIRDFHVTGVQTCALPIYPDLGTLAHRVPRQTRSTVRNLLEDQNITRYSDVRAHTSQSPSRLEVLASEQDPAVSEARSEERRVGKERRGREGRGHAVASDG